MTWPGLNAIGKVTALREVEGKATHQDPLLSAVQPPSAAERFNDDRPRALGYRERAALGARTWS